jgi:hypothetical protein
LIRPFAIIIFCLLASLDVLAQSRNSKRPSTPAAQQAIIDIRQIDFKNFTYTLDARSFKLRDGYYAETTIARTQWELGMVDGPYYGDLTGDGKDEVAFVLSYGAAQAPNASEARVYTLQNGRPVLLATFSVADSINCRLDHYLEVYNGLITVERIIGRDARCDYNEIIGATKRMICRCM